MTSERDDVGAVVTTASSDIYLPNQVPGSASERDDAAAYIRGLEAACATLRAKLTEVERERDEAIEKARGNFFSRYETAHSLLAIEKAKLAAATARAAEAERLLRAVVEARAAYSVARLLDPTASEAPLILAIAALAEHLQSLKAKEPTDGE